MIFENRGAYKNEVIAAEKLQLSSLKVVNYLKVVKSCNLTINVTK